MAGLPRCKLEMVRNASSNLHWLHVPSSHARSALHSETTSASLPCELLMVCKASFGTPSP